MASFMHRSFLAFLVSIAVMVLVSLNTRPPNKQQVEGVCFEWADAKGRSARHSWGLQALGSVACRYRVVVLGHLSLGLIAARSSLLLHVKDFSELLR